MKKFYIGYYNRIDLQNAIKKAVRIPNIILLVFALLLVIVPILFKDRIFKNNSDMSNVVLLQTYDGTGSAIFVGSGSYLLTAAHVVDGMNISDYCDIEFQNPNNTDEKVYARAELLYKGNWQPNTITAANCLEDYALLNVSLIDPKKISKPCQILNNLQGVRVLDPIFVEGYPSGVYSKTNGTINNVNGGVLEDNNFFIVNAVALGGNSGGAMLDANGNLLGIVTMTGTIPGISAGQTIALKIDYIRKELAKHGFVIQ
jgi:S1-C subfamily serine protease